MKYTEARQIIAEAASLMLQEIRREDAHPNRQLVDPNNMPDSPNYNWRNDPYIHPYWKKRWSQGGKGDLPPGEQIPPERYDPKERPEFDRTPNNPHGTGNDTTPPGNVDPTDPKRPGAGPRKPNEEYAQRRPRKPRPWWRGNPTYDPYPGHPVVPDPKLPLPPTPSPLIPKNTGS